MSFMCPSQKLIYRFKVRREHFCFTKSFVTCEELELFAVNVVFKH